MCVCVYKCTQTYMCVIFNLSFEYKKDYICLSENDILLKMISSCTNFPANVMVMSHIFFIDVVSR